MKKLLLSIMALLVLLCGATAFAAAPTDSEIIDAYYKADKVYAWFTRHCLPTNGVRKQEHLYMIYYNVNYPGIRTMADLRRECNKVFTPQMTNNLIATSRTYKEFGGGLYVAAADRGDNILIGETRFEVNRNTANPDYCIILKTISEKFSDHTHKTLVGYQTLEFSYVHTPDGWRFDTFHDVK